MRASEPKPQSITHFPWPNSLDQIYESLSLGSATNPVISQHKARAIEKLRSLGLPNTKTEEYKYTNLSRLGKVKFLPSKGSDQVFRNEIVGEFDAGLFDGMRLVFINGMYSEVDSDLSLAKGIRVQKLTEISDAKKLEAILRLVSPKNKLENFTSCLNDSFWTDGVLVEVTSDFSSPQPLKLIHVYEGDCSEEDKLGFSAVKNVIQLQAGSRASLLECHLGVQGKSYFSSSAVDIDLGEGSTLSHGNVILGSAQLQGFQSTRVQLAAGSHYENCLLSARSKLFRQDLEAYIVGSGAQVDMKGIYLGQLNEHMDFHTAIFHMVPDCESRQLYKGILCDQSRAVFNGKIYIAPGAQRVNSSQLNKSLLMSQGAEIDSKPELEIFADDVKATHGATIGQIDKEELFYLMSRALPKEKAIALLGTGFVKEVLFSFGEGETRELMLGLLESYLNSSYSRVMLDNFSKGGL